jgi:tetratricopeptide (TPR) repeat protein
MDIHEQIERYAFGNLPTDLRNALEEQLATDPDFALMVASEVEMLHALRLAPEVTALRGQLESLENETVTNQIATQNQPTKVLSMYRYLAIAASVLLALVGVWFFSKTPVLTAQELFVAHFQPPTSLGVVKEKRGNNPNAAIEVPITSFSALWQEAEAQYKAGNYKKVLENFAAIRVLPEATDYLPEIDFYMGIAMLKTAQYEAAIASFQKIPAGFYPTEKPWYLALARLAAGEKEAAKVDFEKIALDKSPFVEEAKAILKSL